VEQENSPLDNASAQVMQTTSYTYVLSNIQTAPLSDKQYVTPNCIYMHKTTAILILR